MRTSPHAGGLSRSARPSLAARVARAAAAALAQQHHVSALDVVLGLGWTDGGTVKRWQQGQIDSLEAALQTSPARIAEALGRFRAWADSKGLLAREAPYVGRTPQRQPLRFSRNRKRYERQGLSVEPRALAEAEASKLEPRMNADGR